MRRLVFITCCSIYKIVIDILKKQNSNDYELIGFIDDNKKLTGKMISKMPVLGEFNKLEEIIKDFSITDAVICLPEGYMSIRKKYYEKCVEKGLNMPNFIHPNACISEDAKINNGTIICANTSINPGSKIGNDVIIWTGAIIEHDNYLSDHVYISPGVTLCGGVTVNECVMIGTCAVVTPLITIGKNVNIGAKALVNKNVPDNVTAYGIPAKIIRQNEVI